VGDGGDDLGGSNTSAFGRYRLRWGRREGRGRHRDRDLLKRRKSVRNVPRRSIVKVKVSVRVQAMVDNAAEWI
jgi:hypothetical protein